MHRLPFADNGNINAGWSAIPHCSRIAMHLKAPPLSRLKKKKGGGRRIDAMSCSRIVRYKKFAQECILFFLVFFFFLGYLVLLVRYGFEDIDIY